MRLVTLIVPAFDEAARIVGTIDEALAYFDGRGIRAEIVVAADGTDGTRDAVRAMRRPEVQVIGAPARRGKGRGIREAVRLAAGDVIGFADADNKTPISEFDKIRSSLARGADVVIGSRGLPASRIERAQPLYRRLGARGFAILMRSAVGLHDIADTQCGFKFFQGAVARSLFALQQIDGYMFDVEILYLARRQGYTIEEVPVRWRDDGDSRLRLVSGNIRNMRDLFSIRWRHRALAGAVSRVTNGEMARAGAAAGAPSLTDPREQLREPWPNSPIASPDAAVVPDGATTRERPAAES
jgi:glycosyltransferase involved in cell wall biosynthesis